MDMDQEQWTSRYKELLDQATRRQFPDEFEEVPDGRVPDYLMSGDGSFEPVPLSERALTYESLMALIRRLEDEPWGWQPEPVHPSVGAKSRIMLEAYSLEGKAIRDADLWQLRDQYVRIQEYVQGSGGGRPYSTHDWIHFYSRYGSGGGREISLMVGLRKDTVEEMGRAGMMESEARRTLRILGH